MKKISDFKTIALPYFQNELIASFDGSITSILSAKGLPTILNPTFSAHYLVDHITHDDKVVTTRDTTGEWQYWDDDMTREKARNAGQFAIAVKTFLKENGAYLNGGKYYITVAGQTRRIPGMTSKNA